MNRKLGSPSNKVSKIDDYCTEENILNPIPSKRRHRVCGGVVPNLKPFIDRKKIEKAPGYANINWIRY